jgi:isocitrate dehydrogenase kinase/phosphatase
MYYTISLEPEYMKFDVPQPYMRNYKTHHDVSEAINRIIVNHSIPSNFTTKNIIANWLCRKNKSKKWKFVSVSKIKN